jgi:DNA-binding response OmpR family regulator
MSHAPAGAGNGDGRPLIALAEDNAELRGLLATALEMVGYRVVQEATGDRLVSAMRTLREAGEPPRLIITDVRMPVVGGVEAARLLRAEGDATPLIFMTAFGDAWTRTQAAALGALLLDKPLSIGVLRRAVATVLATT